MSSGITGISAVITFREVGEQMEEYKNISKELQRMLDKAEESDWSYSVYEEPRQDLCGNGEVFPSRRRFLHDN